MLRVLALYLSVVVPLLSSCSRAPVNPRAAMHQARGARLLTAHKLDEAEAQFLLALEYNRAFPEAANGLGLVAFSRGDLHKAVDHYRHALVHN